jgi:hypothetical protein
MDQSAFYRDSSYLLGYSHDQEEAEGYQILAERRTNSDF